jgi:hypothetical protein
MSLKTILLKGATLAAAIPPVHGNGPRELQARLAIVYKYKNDQEHDGHPVEEPELRIVSGDDIIYNISGVVFYGIKNNERIDLFQRLEK